MGTPSDYLILWLVPQGDTSKARSQGATDLPTATQQVLGPGPRYAVTRVKSFPPTSLGFNWEATNLPGLSLG